MLLTDEERQEVRKSYETLNELATRKYRLQNRFTQLQEELQQVRKEIVEVENQLHHGLIKAQPTHSTSGKPKHAKESKTEEMIRQAMKDPLKAAQIVELLKTGGESLAC